MTRHTLITFGVKTFDIKQYSNTEGAYWALEDAKNSENVVHVALYSDDQELVLHCAGKGAKKARGFIKMGQIKLGVKP